MQKLEWISTCVLLPDQLLRAPSLIEGFQDLVAKIRLDVVLDRSQFVVAEYRPITIEQYREHQNAEPQLPRAYTFDIETLTLPDFRETR